MATSMTTEYRVVICYNFLRNLSAKQCFEEITFVLREYCRSLKTIIRWYKQFKSGDFSVEDDLRSGRSAEAVAFENVVAVEKLLKRR